VVLVEKMNLYFAREGVQDCIARFGKVYMHTLKSCLAKPLDNAVKSYELTSHVCRCHARVNNIIQIIADILIHTHHSVRKRKIFTTWHPEICSVTHVSMRGSLEYITSLAVNSTVSNPVIFSYKFIFSAQNHAKFLMTTI